MKIYYTASVPTDWEHPGILQGFEAKYHYAGTELPTTAGWYWCYWNWPARNELDTEEPQALEVYKGYLLSDGCAFEGIMPDYYVGPIAKPEFVLS